VPRSDAGLFFLKGVVASRRERVAQAGMASAWSTHCPSQRSTAVANHPDAAGTARPAGPLHPTIAPPLASLPRRFAPHAKLLACNRHGGLLYFEVPIDPASRRRGGWEPTW